MAKHSFDEYRVVTNLLKTLDRLKIYSLENYRTGPKSHSFPVIDFTDKWFIK